MPCKQHYDRAVARTLCVGCALACLLALGCSRTSGSDSSPASCVSGSPAGRVAAFRAALASAPGPVRLKDGTSIADCLSHDADSGDLQNVGSMLLTITQQLVDSGAHDSRTLVQIGYLSGAVRRGAEHSQVDGEIERRIDQEMGTVNTQAPAFVRGERAGRAHG
jgi:hypothetical protein